MKQILLLCLVALTFASCEDKKSGKLDPNSKIYINGVIPKTITPALATAPAANLAAQTVLTPLEVVQQAQIMLTNIWTMEVEDWNRDITNIRFALGSGYIVTKDGVLVPDMIEARNYIFVTRGERGAIKDTVAYIPNAVMNVAEPAIRTAYAAENYDECNRLFMEAFVFIPTTGAEYRALKEAGHL